LALPGLATRSLIFQTWQEFMELSLSRLLSHLPLLARIQLNRREVLSYAWLGALGALGVAAIDAGLKFALPRAAPGKLGGVFDLGPLANLPTADMPPLSRPDGRFWLVTTPQGLIAVQNVCTHLDCLCNWDEQARQFVCPCHGSRFSAEGSRLDGPAPRALDRLVVQLVDADGALVAETDPHTGAPLPTPGSPDSKTLAGDAAMASEEDEQPAESIAPELFVRVDTGRKIIMATSS
jgi:cytochrome b6-f complex iron-sulfur subunit